MVFGELCKLRNVLIFCVVVYTKPASNTKTIESGLGQKRVDFIPDVIQSSALENAQVKGWDLYGQYPEDVENLGKYRHINYCVSAHPCQR